MSDERVSLVAGFEPVSNLPLLELLVDVGRESMRWLLLRRGVRQAAGTPAGSQTLAVHERLIILKVTNKYKA